MLCCGLFSYPTPMHCRSSGEFHPCTHSMRSLRTPITSKAEECQDFGLWNKEVTCCSTIERMWQHGIECAASHRVSTPVAELNVKPINRCRESTQVSGTHNHHKLVVALAGHGVEFHFDGRRDNSNAANSCTHELYSDSGPRQSPLSQLPDQ